MHSGDDNSVGSSSSDDDGDDDDEMTPTERARQRRRDRVYEEALKRDHQRRRRGCCCGAITMAVSLCWLITRLFIGLFFLTAALRLYHRTSAAVSPSAFGSVDAQAGALEGAS